MKDSSKNRKGKMGALNNQFTELIDKSDLTPPEIAIVLQMLIERVIKLFEAMVRGGK